MRIFFTFCAIVGFVTIASAAIRCDFSISGEVSEVNLNEVSAEGLRAIKSQPRNVKFRATKDLDKNWRKFSVAFTPSRPGEVKITLGNNNKSGANAIAYDAFKLTGARLRNPSFEVVAGGLFEGWEPPSNAEPPEFFPLRYINTKDARDGKNYTVVIPNSIAQQEFSVTGGQRVVIEFYAKLVPNVKLPIVVAYEEPFKNDFPKEFYRLYNDKVKYLPLSHKGVSPASVRKWFPTLENFTDFPAPKFAVPPISSKNQLADVKIPVELLEESGVAGVKPIRFGFPLPQGGLFDVAHLRVIAPDGKEIPAQVTASAFWKDGSVKVALVLFAAPMRANEKAVYSIEVGKNVRRAQFASPLKIQAVGDVIRVNTGRLTAEINRKKSGFLQNISVDGKNVGSFAGNALELRDESGAVVPMLPPTTVKIEERGLCRGTILLSGNFGSNTEPYGSYVARIGFLADSPVVNFDVRFIDTNLRHEFFDLTSLALVYRHGDTAKLSLGGTVGDKFFMEDENSQLAEYGSISGKSSAISFDVVDAKYRYPKGFAVSGDIARFELLPELPSPKFGTDLPYYLQFPLCEGKYRLKWGMAFSQEFRFDFSGATSPESLTARSVVPVIDRDWLHRTAAWQGVGPASETCFAQYDQKAVEAFYEHLRLKKIQREYGFLNYGDWFGERHRNWGNNEYDLASGLFMLFLRTGNRDVFRWAKIAARHQADVDIIHAYPDPSFLGANPQHSIGHSGVSYERVNPATWSWRFRASALGTNGHTWSGGMCQAFTLAGDAMTMDSALKLGEHLTRCTVPYFKRLTTHQRSAGWSGKALMELYNATGDVKYLNGAKRLAELVMDEQKFNYGGAWPHKMPNDHGAGCFNTYGNCGYLVGIVLEFLRQLEVVESTPELRKSIAAAGMWQYRNFDAGQIGFGYGVSWDNHAYGDIGDTLNSMVAPSLGVTARVTGDRKPLDALEAVWDTFVVAGFSPFGKALAYGLIMAPSMMDEMRRFSAEHPEKPLYAFSAERMENTLRKYKTEKLYVRYPEKRLFKIVLNAPSAEFTIERRNPLRNIPQKQVARYSYTVTDERGNVVATAKNNLENLADKIQLSGSIGQEFTVTLKDALGTYWNVTPDRGCVVFLQLVPRSQFKCECVVNLYLTIPAGVTEFDVNVIGTHNGPFAAWIFDGDKKLAETFGLKYSSVPAERLMKVKCDAADHTRVMQLTLRSCQDIKVVVGGIPPFVSIEKVSYQKK